MSSELITELNERVDMERLRIIRDNSEVVYERMGKKCKILNQATGRYEEADFKTFQTLMNEMYLAKVKSSSVLYKYGTKVKYGRRSAKLSLQGCPRPIRHAISKELYYDIDIKNAHPTILLRWCKKKNFSHPRLEEYVSQRDEVLRRYIGCEMRKWNDKKRIHEKIVADKDAVKSGLLAILNGGSNPFPFPDEFVTDFETTQKKLLKEFSTESRHPENHKYVQRARDNKEKEYNKEGSALNFYLCDVEDQILQHMEKFVAENQIEVGALCFDGFMPYRENVKNIDELCRGLSAYVSEKMEFSFHLTHKPMEEAVSLDGLTARSELDTSDSAYGKYLYEKLRDKMKYHSAMDKLYLYDEETRLWKLSKFEFIYHLMPSLLHPLVETSPDVKLVEKEKARVCSTSTQRNILTQLKSLVCSHQDDNFIHLHFDNKTGLFPLADNQVIDLRTGEVREREKEDYFTKTTERKIVPMEESSQHEYVLNYYREMLSVMNDKGELTYPSVEHVECLLYCMAYILTGENSLKKFIQLIGSGDNGKSLFIHLHEEMMGGFAVQGNKRTFIKKKNESIHDAEKVKLLNTRMVVLSELDEREEFNETFLKLLTGGDKDDIRECGGRGSESFQVRYTCIPLIASNFTPKISEDSAFRNRLLCFNFGNKFPRKDGKKEELLSHIDLFFTNLCRYAKKYYDNDRQIVISNEADKYTREQISSKDVVLSFIHSKKLVKTERKTDMVMKDDLWNEFSEFLRENDLEFGRNKFFASLKKHLQLEEPVQRENVIDSYGATHAKPYVYLQLKMEV